MMVPQPSRTLDLQRKEELMIQKQIRQSTCKVKNNLPTLIEASPDFNSKKLPYLPYLPDSVQSLASLQYDDTSESIVTDDLMPSLYSVPHKFRSESRCSSITFDLTDAEGYNRNRSRSKNKKQKERKEESQANIFAREEPDLIIREPVVVKEKKKETKEEEESYLSMWSCRRCTLENPLQEAVCLACGGSRLSSIGDIEVPRTVEPRNLVNLIREEVEEDVVMEEVLNTNNHNVDQPRPKWKCGVCTLENEALNYFCDACNSPSPEHAARRTNTKEDVITGAGADPNMEFGIIFSKAVRYLGIACFCLIILCAMFNMVSSLIHFLQTFLQPNQSFPSQQTLTKIAPPPVTAPVPPPVNVNNEEIGVSSESHNSIAEDGTAGNYAEVMRLTDEGQVRETDDAEEDSDDSVYIYQIFYESFGVFPIIFLIYWPLFLYLIAQLCKVGEGVTQPRVPQPL